MRHRRLDEIEEEIACGVLALDEAVAELADGGRDGDLARLAGARLRLHAELAGRLLLEAEHAPAALACRALGLSLNGYSALLRLRRRRAPAAPIDPAALMGAYLRLARLTPAELAARLGLDAPAAGEG